MKTMNLPIRPRSLSSFLSAAVLMVGLGACDNDPAQPASQGELGVDASIVSFSETDLVLGSIETPHVTLSNRGGGDLTIESVSLEGSGASAFTFEGATSTPFAIAPGGEREISVRFSPSSAGTFAASLRVASDDPTDGDATVSLSGTASTFTFAQVDRAGIPALNTVFNHPSGVPGFDKTAYNVASPADDIATYRATFVVVLDAVGNPDSGATADLLLPDELPVDMGAPTAFANLTGRTPADDATDVALAVTVGVAGLQSDHVDSNDVGFLNGFPYLAAPH
jgi:hypothetical protein